MYDSQAERIVVLTERMRNENRWMLARKARQVVRCTPTELQLWQLVAEVQGFANVSSWVRAALADAAKVTVEQAHKPRGLSK